MSDFDENEMQDENSDFSEQELTPEDVFKMALINKVNNTTTRVELQDAEGDTVELADVVAQLIEYIHDKLQTPENSDFVDQIMPLMAQAMVSGLGRDIGISNTAFLMANSLTKNALIDMMCLAFLLLKFVQQKNLTIATYEEQLTEEEVENITRKSKANDVATLSSFMGQNPKELLEQLVEMGKLNPEDLQDLLGDKTDDGELN